MADVEMEAIELEQAAKVRGTHPQQFSDILGQGLPVHVLSDADLSSPHLGEEFMA